MPTSRRRPAVALALALLTAVCVSACSSMAGTPTAGEPVALSRSTASSSTAPPPAVPGITVPSTTPVPGTSSSAADAASGTVGSAGIGDPYYPDAGNGGYQVDHYDVNVTYDPASNQLTATTTITGAVTSEQGLTRFNLDLQPNLTVSAVTVNDAPGAFEQDDTELVITPSTELA